MIMNFRVHFNGINNKFLAMVIKHAHNYRNASHKYSIRCAMTFPILLHFSGTFWTFTVLHSVCLCVLVACDTEWNTQKYYDWMSNSSRPKIGILFHMAHNCYIAFRLDDLKMCVLLLLQCHTKYPATSWIITNIYSTLNHVFDLYNPSKPECAIVQCSVSHAHGRVWH